MSIKSLCAFARIATREKDGDIIATEICMILDEVENGTGNAGTVERRYRPDGFVDAIMDAMTDGTNFLLDKREVPVIAVCHGMQDLCLSWTEICKKWRVEPVARSASDFFSLSLYSSKRLDAIIFDMRHIMPRGIDGMSEATGISRDGTAMTDCRIMKAYAWRTEQLHGLYDKNGDYLGSKVLTLTSMARHEVDAVIGHHEYRRRRGNGHIDRTLLADYRIDAATEAARTYEDYACRRACMRGGFAFNAARESNRILGRVVSIDETSAHHAHAIGHYVPEGFTGWGSHLLQAAAERIVRMTPGAVMASYHHPFLVAMHVQVRFEGLRLRRGSVFEASEIGLESTARLASSEGIKGIDNESMVEAERGIRAAGYRDQADEYVAAFGKVMTAEALTTWVTEIELWCMSRVYEWDRMSVICGEATGKRKRPDDYAILTSMHFWRGKQDLKARIASMPDGPERRSLQVRYDSEVKPQFNAVGYGLHARDEYRPSWSIDRDGKWSLGEAVTPETFDERRPRRPKAWLNYGSRIAGWSRLHLILAMELLYEKFGDDARIVTGDTDSMKIATGRSEDEIIEALGPLHDATRRAIDRVTSRAKDMWPEDFDPMTGVGEFVAERTSTQFFTSGVKQYIQEFDDGSIKVTCAGLPDGQTSFSAWIRQMRETWGFGIVEHAMGFDVRLSPGVSQLIEVDFTEVNGTERLPRPKGVRYTLNCLDDADTRATLDWQQAHGRAVQVDCTAECSWTTAGARFTYRDGILDS